MLSPPDHPICSFVEDLDLVIVGAGPAGLAAAAAASEHGLSFMLLERGLRVAHRDRSDSDHLVTGVGGAGLYSDGKFSFAPSATALWRLEPQPTLRDAYGWVATLLAQFDLVAPPFPEEVPTDVVDGEIKRYPSKYLSLEDRLSLISNLESRVRDHVVTGAYASLAASDDTVSVTFEGRSGFTARTAIIASGRFGPLDDLPGVRSSFRRVEVGMRVEQPADLFALDRGGLGDALDPKWIARSDDGRLEWRTFCCCRRGEVVETRFGDLVTVSGRADGPPTDRSNFGLNVRLLDRLEAEFALSRAIEAAGRPALRVTADDLLHDWRNGRVVDTLGPVVTAALSEGLKRLATVLDVDFSDGLLHLPAIEGVGYYPAVERHLRVSDTIWVAGDASGAFRGIVPALVSGRMAALEIADRRRGG